MGERWQKAGAPRSEEWTTDSTLRSGEKNVYGSMMFRLILAFFAFAVPPAISWAASTDASYGVVAPARADGYFLNPGAVDVRKILPPPPAPDSPAGRADLETVLQMQAARAAEQVAWAKFIEEDDVFKNDRVLGGWWSAKNLPETAAFFAKVDADLGGLGAKKLFARLRPPFADARVHPCVHVPDSSSYPSGHALRAWLWAGLLAEIFPEWREPLAERARAVCWGRVIGGAHFPSDTTAGKVLADGVVAALLKNPAVRAELAKCRAEAQPFLLKKAA
jgi:acid phosphatase (class A)